MVAVAVPEVQAEVKRRAQIDTYADDAYQSMMV